MSRAILGLVLRLAPRHIRSAYAEEILAVHADRMSRRSGLGRFRLAAREIAGAALFVLRVRLGGDSSRSLKRLRTPGGGASPPLDGLRRDVRFGARSLRRSPGFALAAIAVLAIGIGANTAIFSAVNAFLFRPLPFADADRLVMLYETNPEFDWTHAQAAPANVMDWREQVDAFDDVAVYSEFVGSATHVRDGRPELLGTTAVSGNFFSLLGVRPDMGRAFEWDNTWDGEDDVVVMSHAAWTSKFGADPDIVGRTLDIGGQTVRVLGVMPEGFDFPNERTDLWYPWGWEREARDQVWFRRAHFVRPIARLAPGVGHEEANADFQVVVGRLQTDYPETNRVMGAGLMPLRDFLVMDARGPLLLLVGAVVLLLLLACTNVANLMLVRTTDRMRDVALRVALGAGRARVARQMLVEGLLLALVGGAIGLAGGWLGIRALSAQQPVGIAGATELTLDYRVILFTVTVAILSALLFGTAPALRGARGDVQEALKDGARSGEGRWGLKTANVLVATQVALTFLLVVGAGLMVRTFTNLRDVDPGFRTESVLAVRVSMSPDRYGERDAVLAFEDELSRALEGRPGILRVGVVGQLPLNGSSWSSQFQAEGWPPERVGLEILHRRADPGYFEALEIPLLRGRMFEPSDGPDAPLVVVINETFAREHFPGEDPIGQRIAYDRAATSESTWYEIIGIVGDQAQETPGQPPRAEVFENRRQDWARGNWFVIRTTGDASRATATVRSALAEIDPLVPISTVRPLREVWQSSMAREEFLLTLLAVFAAAALSLAAVGVYGVTAQAARKRTHEIGIRLALGARSREVLGMILRQGLFVVAVGLGVGAIASLVATRALGAFLHGVEPTDPLTIAAVVGLLALVAAAACYLPARRAASVDPADALRAE